MFAANRLLAVRWTHSTNSFSLAVLGYTKAVADGLSFRQGDVRLLASHPMFPGDHWKPGVVHPAKPFKGVLAAQPGAGPSARKLQESNHRFLVQHLVV